MHACAARGRRRRSLTAPASPKGVPGRPATGRARSPSRSGGAAPRQADVVFHERWCIPARSRSAGGRARRGGKRCGRHSTAHASSQRLVDAARQARRRCAAERRRPELFGRAQEEMTPCATRASRSRSYPASRALARGRAGRVAHPARRRAKRDIRDAARRAAHRRIRGRRGRDTDTGAIYMGAGEAAAVAGALRAGQARQPPVVAIENAPAVRGAGTRRWGLAAPRERVVRRPVMLLLGEVFADALVREQFLARRGPTCCSPPADLLERPRLRLHGTRRGRSLSRRRTPPALRPCAATDARAPRARRRRERTHHQRAASPAWRSRLARCPSLHDAGRAGRPCCASHGSSPSPTPITSSGRAAPVRGGEPFAGWSSSCAASLRPMSTAGVR